MLSYEGFFPDPSHWVGYTNYNPKK